MGCCVSRKQKPSKKKTDVTTVAKNSKLSKFLSENNETLLTPAEFPFPDVVILNGVAFHRSLLKPEKIQQYKEEFADQQRRIKEFLLQEKSRRVETEIPTTTTTTTNIEHSDETRTLLDKRQNTKSESETPLKSTLQHNNSKNLAWSVDAVETYNHEIAEEDEDDATRDQPRPLTKKSSSLTKQNSHREVPKDDENQETARVSSYVNGIEGTIEVSSDSNSDDHNSQSEDTSPENEIENEVDKRIRSSGSSRVNTPVSATPKVNDNSFDTDSPTDNQNITAEYKTDPTTPVEDLSTPANGSTIAIQSTTGTIPIVNGPLSGRSEDHVEPSPLEDELASPTTIQTINGVVDELTKAARRDSGSSTSSSSKKKSPQKTHLKRSSVSSTGSSKKSISPRKRITPRRRESGSSTASNNSSSRKYKKK